MPDFDHLGMAPVIVVDLESEIVDTSVDPMSADRESDTNVPPPSAMEALKVDMAVEEISQLLREIPLGQPPTSEAAESGSGPELSVPLNRETTTGEATRLRPPTPTRPLFQIELPTQYPARREQRLHALPRAALPVVRLQLCSLPSLLCFSMVRK